MACTTILVGKKASTDGSTMMARNNDMFVADTPQKIQVIPSKDDQTGKYVSNKNGFTFDYPKKAYRYQMVPNVNVEKEGIFGGSGFNEKNVGISATESVYANEHVLAFDPLVKNGIAEDSMVVAVLPYIDSAKHGVEYLGEIIKTSGSPEGNGVVFSDKDEVWYMEIVTGHHWVAQRIPEDHYAVIANQVAQEEIDFDDPENFMWSEGIQEFVEKNHLNPDHEGFNFRHIFGTDTEKDRYYNTPRVWFGQRYFNPEIDQSPVSSKLPFLQKANRKISLEDIAYILGSHYNETVYDPYGKGSEREKHLYRPIALNRTQDSHIMQVRNHVPEELSTIMWVCLGVPAFNPHLPFYGNATDSDPSFNDTKLDWNLADGYWMYRTITALVEGHYSELIESDSDFVKDCRENLIRLVAETDEQAQSLQGAELTDYLTKRNHEIVDAMKEKAMKYIGELVKSSIDLSKLTYKMDINL
ncbi:C69 family dipeptidase [Enterococcus devriesei]|uniref:Dipeptidase n=1 Tax=Enterococcus devriesei TaxID=319970 RepID=A0A1L8ST11_9ENTE|nr:C69 family dipeptidase [Enterococcus devriesei]MDT2820950.1 C69 family dipeptidase [Enterococcus devriesei]OJG35108.1 hypothetical protein RV00_GL003127 [Enterococcus devriesei]